MIAICSIIALNGATKDDVPGSPNYYVYRQVAFASIGFVLMLIFSRIDYSRLRELKYVVYGGMIGAVVVTYFVGTVTNGTLWMSGTGALLGGSVDELKVDGRVSLQRPVVTTGGVSVTEAGSLSVQNNGLYIRIP